jgi:uncharacterized protein
MLLFLFASALLAGTVNGVAGGGGLIAFPALIIAGVPPLSANATNAAALWFGTAASTFAYRHYLFKEETHFFLLTIISVIGGIIGSYLLLHTSSHSFAAFVPYLMLIATLLFTFNQLLLRWFSQTRLPMAAISLLQLGIGIYGGYFGGGGGILMMAVFSIIGIKNIHTMNGLKCWLATCLNAVAILHFAIARQIFWLEAAVMAAGALIGGYGSAYIARKLDPSWVRYFVICMAWGMTAYFFFPLK